MKQFLITGGAGFIGSHLVDFLLSQKHSVIVVDNFCDFYDPKIKRENVKEHLKNSLYKLYEGDLCDYGFVKKVFKENEITHVVHLAAMAGVRPSLENPVMYQKVNNESTVNLLDIVTKINSSKLDAEIKLLDSSFEEFKTKPKIEKFVFGSSSSVYGARSKVPFCENEDISKPISPYAATKVSGEAMCHTFAHLYKLPTVSLRFFTVYGPRQRPDLAIHKFTKLIDQGKSIPMFGDGSAKRDFTYIDDIIDGIVKAIDYDVCKNNPNSCSDIFNLGESKTTSVIELINIIENKLGKKAIIDQLPNQPGDVPITCADVSKSKAKLGYNPVTEIDEGIEKFVAWYLQTKNLVRA